jgi:hypothetical protein
MTIWTVSDVNGSLQPVSAPIVISGSIGIQSLAAFDGTGIAIAAARDRVAITWRSKHALVAGDPTGGYAILSCPAS